MLSSPINCGYPKSNFSLHHVAKTRFMYKWSIDQKLGKREKEREREINRILHLLRLLIFNSSTVDSKIEVVKALGQLNFAQKKKK